MSQDVCQGIPKVKSRGIYRKTTPGDVQEDYPSGRTRERFYIQCPEPQKTTRAKRRQGNQAGCVSIRPIDQAAQREGKQNFQEEQFQKRVPLWVWQMAQVETQEQHELLTYEELSLDPRTQVRSQVWPHVSVTLALWGPETGLLLVLVALSLS